MRRPVPLLAAAALGLCACSAPAPPASPASPPPAAAVGAPAPAPVLPPPPEALTDVLYRLADPTVPGPDKLELVAGATAPEAATLDRFAAALRDGGFSPVRFAASDIRPADAPSGEVLATITVTGPESGSARPATFWLPMQFRARAGGWQLTRDTAEMLLAFGTAPAAVR